MNENSDRNSRPDGEQPRRSSSAPRSQRNERTDDGNRRSGYSARQDGERNERTSPRRDAGGQSDRRGSFESDRRPAQRQNGRDAGGGYQRDERRGATGGFQRDDRRAPRDGYATREGRSPGPRSQTGGAQGERPAYGSRPTYGSRPAYGASPRDERAGAGRDDRGGFRGGPRRDNSPERDSERGGAGRPERQGFRNRGELTDRGDGRGAPRGGEGRGGDRDTRDGRAPFGSNDRPRGYGDRNEGRSWQARDERAPGARLDRSSGPRREDHSRDDRPSSARADRGGFGGSRHDDRPATGGSVRRYGDDTRRSFGDRARSEEPRQDRAPRSRYGPRRDETGRDERNRTGNDPSGYRRGPAQSPSGGEGRAPERRGFGASRRTDSGQAASPRSDERRPSTYDRQPANREGRPPAGDYRPPTGVRRDSSTARGGLRDRPVAGRQDRRDDRPRDDHRTGGARPAQDARGDHSPEHDGAEIDQRRNGPVLPEDVAFSELDRDARGRLRTLSKDNAEAVGRHLVMVARLIDVDPELAYEHAQEAVRRGGRVDIVREAAGIAAYRTGRYAESLRELRTVRRLNGSSEHLPVMADCERGLGRPERAIALAATPEAETLDAGAKVELAIVVSGARADLGDHDAALAVLDQIHLPTGDRTAAARVAVARSAVHEAAGRAAEAAGALSAFTAEEIAAASGAMDDEDSVVVYDLTEELAPEADVAALVSAGRPETSDPASDTDVSEEDVRAADTPEAGAAGDAEVADDETTVVSEDDK